MTKFLNISTDNTLGGSSASDEVVSSQKALKTYIDNNSGGLPDQTGHSGNFLITNGTDASWGLTVSGTFTNYYSGDAIKLNANSSHSATRDIKFRVTTDALLIGYGNNNVTKKEFCFSWQGNGGFYPINWASGTAVSLGSSTYKWGTLYATTINNGADITIPNQSGTMIVANTTGATAGQVITLDSNLIPVWADVSSGSVAIDNSTITKNSSDEIQAVATVNANTAVGASNPVVDWVGTLAEYNSQTTPAYAWQSSIISSPFFSLSENPVAGDALYNYGGIWLSTVYTVVSVSGTTMTLQDKNGNTFTATRQSTDDTNMPIKSTNWLCYITDDLTSGAYDAYSKSQTNTLLANKVSVGHEVIEFQAPTAQNNYTWYRKYADGWVEQGGRVEQSAPAWTTVNLPVQMADTNYSAYVSQSLSTTAQFVNASCGAVRLSVSQIQISTYSQVGKMDWEVKGMAA